MINKTKMKCFETDFDCLSKWESKQSYNTCKFDLLPEWKFYQGYLLFVCCDNRNNEFGVYINMSKFEEVIGYEKMFNPNSNQTTTEDPHCCVFSQKDGKISRCLLVACALRYFQGKKNVCQLFEEHPIFYCNPAHFDYKGTENALVNDSTNGKITTLSVFKHSSKNYEVQFFVNGSKSGDLIIFDSNTTVQDIKNTYYVQKPLRGHSKINKRGEGGVIPPTNERLKKKKHGN
ncbi:hypothetical protein QTN25_007754 [Entamoeba marina]